KIFQELRPTSPGLDCEMKNIESQNQNQCGRAQRRWHRWSGSVFSSAINGMRVLANTVFLCAAVLSMDGTAIAQTQEQSGTHDISPFLAANHFSRGKSAMGQGDTQALARETEDAIAGRIAHPIMRPTRSSFLAKWQPVSGATGYRLDVSTSRSFDSYVANYGDLDLGNVTNCVVTGLNRGTKYYYRVRPYSSAGIGSSSEAASVTTSSTSSGLVIIPTFDSTITNDP